MDKHGFTFTMEMYTALVSETDWNGDGVIDREEF